MRVNTGDVVLAKYMNFDGEITTGMFVICYHECYDKAASTSITAIKICTKPGCYQFPLLKEYLPFLDHNSFLNCNMQFRFREDQVLRICGKLNTYYYNKMLQQLNHYYEAMANQIKNIIGEENLFVFEDNKETMFSR